jgi:hypothetical protein
VPAARVRVRLVELAECCSPSIRLWLEAVVAGRCAAHSRASPDFADPDSLLTGLPLAAAFSTASDKEPAAAWQPASQPAVGDVAWIAWHSLAGYATIQAVESERLPGVGEEVASGLSGQGGATRSFERCGCGGGSRCGALAEGRSGPCFRANINYA